MRDLCISSPEYRTKNLTVVNKCVEYGKVQILGMTVTNQYYLHEEIKRGLNLRSAWYPSVQHCLHVTSKKLE